MAWPTITENVTKATKAFFEEIKAWVLEQGGAKNVLNYGADPTGVANSTAAFEAALTAAGKGGAVYAPSGTYLIEGTLKVTERTLYGTSPTATIFTTKQNATAMFVMENENSVLRNFAVKCLTTATSGSAIKLSWTYTFAAEPAIIENVAIYKAYNGIEVTGPNTNFVVIANLYQSEFVHYGVYIHGSGSEANGSGSVTITNFEFLNKPAGEGGTGTHLRFENFVAGCVFTNGECYGGEYGLSATAAKLGTNEEPNANRFESVYFDTNSKGCVLTNTRWVKFLGCWFATGVHGASSGVGITLENCEQVAFLGCDFYANFNGATIKAPCYNVEFIGCSFEGCASAGIEPESSYFSVIGCSFSPAEHYTAEWGVIVRNGGSPTDFYVISGNTFNLVHATQNVLDEGAGNNKYVESRPGALISGTSGNAGSKLGFNTAAPIARVAESLATGSLGTPTEGKFGFATKAEAEAAFKFIEQFSKWAHESGLTA